MARATGTAGTGTGATVTERETVALRDHFEARLQAERELREQAERAASHALEMQAAKYAEFIADMCEWRRGIDRAVIQARFLAALALVGLTVLGLLLRFIIP